MAEKELQFEDLFFKSTISYQENESARLRVDSFVLLEGSGGTRYVLENLEDYLVVQKTQRARRRQRGYRSYKYDDGNSYFDVSWSSQPVIAEAVLYSGGEGSITMPLYEAVTPTEDGCEKMQVPAGCITVLGLSAIKEVVLFADGQDVSIYTPAPENHPDIFVPFTARQT